MALLVLGTIALLSWGLIQDVLGETSTSTWSYPGTGQLPSLPRSATP